MEECPPAESEQSCAGARPPDHTRRLVRQPATRESIFHSRHLRSGAIHKSFSDKRLGARRNAGRTYPKGFVAILPQACGSRTTPNSLLAFAVRVPFDRPEASEDIDRGAGHRDSCRGSATSLQRRDRARLCKELVSKGVTALRRSAWRLRTPSVVQRIRLFEPNMNPCSGHPNVTTDMLTRAGLVNRRGRHWAA